MPGLKDYWRDTRTKEDPKQSPAIAALSALSCAGRASRHPRVADRPADDRRASAGGRDSTIRTNAGIKAHGPLGPAGLGRWRVGKHVPMPPQTYVPGRIHVVTGDGVRETQVPLPAPETRTRPSRRKRSGGRGTWPCPAPSRRSRAARRLPPQLGPPASYDTNRCYRGRSGRWDGGTVTPAPRPRRRCRGARGGHFGERTLWAVRKAAQRAGSPAGMRGTAHESRSSGRPVRAPSEGEHPMTTPSDVTASDQRGRDVDAAAAAVHQVRVVAPGSARTSGPTPDRCRDRRWPRR